MKNLPGLSMLFHHEVKFFWHLSDPLTMTAISLKEPLADADKVLRLPERIADMPDSRDQFDPGRSPHATQTKLLTISIAPEKACQQRSSVESLREAANHFRLPWRRAYFSSSNTRPCPLSPCSNPTTASPNCATNSTSALRQ